MADDGFALRFPQLAKLLEQFSIDPAKQLIPVHPAAHYMIGGVDADMTGRSSLPGLYAVGEAGCSGLHGANRLGSNSLLEGLAFGAGAGEDAARAAEESGTDGEWGPTAAAHLEHRISASPKTTLDIADVKSSLKAVMWRNVGIERTGDRLDETREIISFWSRYVMDKTFDPAALGPSVTAGWELQNMLTICALITWAAQARTESRGVHYRVDYPQRDDAHWRLHLLWRRPAETPLPEPLD